MEYSIRCWLGRDKKYEPLSLRITFQCISSAVVVQECGLILCEQQMAVEMVLTLGQAFEVAYQLAMRKNSALEPRDAPCRLSLIHI